MRSPLSARACTLQPIRLTSQPTTPTLHLAVASSHPRQLLLLALAFVTGRFLEKIKFKWMGEAGSALLISLVVGVVLWAAGLSKHAKSAVAFQVGAAWEYAMRQVLCSRGGRREERVRRGLSEHAKSAVAIQGRVRVKREDTVSGVRKTLVPAREAQLG